jgi:uncharacterized protein YbjT (DUF2867 family)
MITIAVAGGTGVVGHHVVESLRRQGHRPVVISRSGGVDLVTGEGVDDALAGVDAVIDVTNIVTQNRGRATAFFETATRHLLTAEERQGVGHHVRTGPVPWTILRATQFHEFAAQMLGDGPVALVPSMLSQPVAAREVADELVRLATAPAAGMAPDLAGPQRERVPDMARRLAAARGRRGLVLTVPVPGATGRGMRTGALLPTGPGPRGRQTFDEWLTEAQDDQA